MNKRHSDMTDNAVCNRDGDFDSLNPVSERSGHGGEESVKMDKWSRMGGLVKLALIVMIAITGLAGFGTSADAALVTYHMRGLAAQSVGVDGNTNVVSEAAATYQPITGTQWRAIMSTTASSSTSRNRFREGATFNVWAQFLRMYTPVYSPGMTIGANATVSFDVYSAAGSVYAELHEYNDTTGYIGLRGTTNTLNYNTVPSHNILTFDNASFTVATGNRLVVWYYLNGNGNDTRPIYGAAAYNAVTPAGDLYLVVDETAACSDSDAATLTVTSQANNDTVVGSVLIQAQIGTETAPDTMSNMTVAIGGSTCADTGGAMAWNAGSSRWEYTWNTAGCGDPVETNITIDVSGDDPDCGTPTSATQITGITLDNTCTEPQPSIVWTAQNTAAGDFSGLPFVTLTNINSGTMEYQVTEGSMSPPFTTLTDDYTGKATLAQDWTGLNWVPALSSESKMAWCTLTTNSASTGTLTNPGNPVPMIYLESSGTGQSGVCGQAITAASENYLESPVLDGDAYYYTVSFDYNMEVSSASAELRVDVWDSVNGWVNDVFPVATGNQGTAWQSTGNLDLTSYINTNSITGNIQIRITAIPGATVTGDIAIDNLVLSGTPRSSETTLIPWTSDPIPASANLTDANTYNLYARGNSTTCSVQYFGDTVANDVSPGNPTTFTWSACTPTAGASVAIGSPANGASLNGTVSIVPNYTLTKNAQYRINGGSWVDVATGWNTLAAFPGSNTTPVTGVLVEIQAIDNNDCAMHTNSITVTVDNRVDTAAGTATAVASGIGSIAVSMPYGADVNNTSAYDVDYKLCSAGSWTVWVNGASYTPSPYTTTITGLTADECYDVRMTYGETADAVSGTAVQTVNNIYILSNATRLDSPATVVAVNANSIQVTAPYTGDLDNSNDVLVEWSNAGGGAYVNSQPLSHTASPYTYTIASLTEQSTYDVRVTYNDNSYSGTYGNVQTFTVNTPSSYTWSSMMHNSETLGTKYWSGSGGWGVPGGKYGAFTCSTCHQAGTTNIKKVKTSIPSTIGPAVAKTVVLQNTSGALSYGDDSRADKTQSSGVCEVCHTLTSAHRYDMSGLGDSGHSNASDCMDCHAHNAGFKGAGACDLCHDQAVAASKGAPAVFDKTGGSYNGAAYGTHLKATNGDNLGAVTDWAVQCGKCHNFHADGTDAPDDNEVEISTAAVTFGSKYPSHSNSIILGGTDTGAFETEAEMCWNCHSSNGISEWEDAGDAGDTYKYGTLATSDNWVSGGDWTSSTADFAYKTGPITSTHEAAEVVGSNITIGASDKAASASEISCAVCHDVHNGKTYDGTTAGAPYLRGSWHPSQYAEDGAPAQNNTTGFISRSYTSPATHTIVAGPGENPIKVQTSGYHIDDNTFGVTGTGWGNNNWGTASNLTTVNSGNNAPDYSATTNLCNQCHGTLANLITKWAGHGAVRGAAAQTDIFKPIHAERQHGQIQNFEGWSIATGNARFYWDMGSNAGDGATGSYYRWAVNLPSQKTAGYKQKYHNFSCSKCHTPHASRLPRLRVNNCLNRDFVLTNGSGALGTSLVNARGTGINAANVLKGWMNSRTENDTTTSSKVGNGYAGTDSEGVAVDNYTGLNYRGGKQAIHCHNNTETGASTNYWQNIP